MTSVLRRGIVAGLAGAAALDAAGYADMALRDRPASAVPGRTVAALADRAGLGTPKGSRRTALGQLAGAVTGIAVGTLGAGLRSAGVRFPAPFEAALLGGMAMAAADVPAAALGITDPRSWSRQDWVADAVPHLGFGLAASAALRATEDPAPVPARAGAGLVVRSALLGLAAGARSTLGVAAPVLTSATAGLPSRVGALLGVAGELTGDKLPVTPARTSPPSFAGRLGAGAAGGAALARRDGSNAALPALAGLAGAAGGTLGGLAWRTWADRRVPDWQAALAEDAVAVTVAFLAARPARP